MMIQLPLLWATLCFICGILLGHFYASWIYVMLAIGILLMMTFLRHHKYLYVILVMTFWFMLGGARISIPANQNILTFLKEKAEPAREKLKSRFIEAGITDESLALSTALLTGDKSLLEKDTRKAYSRAGASHILALSGMHLGIIYGLIYILLLHWGRYSQWRWHLLPPVLLCLWGYALLAGMPISLMRATIMLSLFTVGSLAQYKQPSLHLLSLSALIILLVSPKALFDIGFQLSFIAVFFIVTLYPSIKVFYRGIRFKWMWEMLGVSFVAQLGTAPLSIYYFHTLPLIGFLLSLFIIPLTMIIIYIGLITMILPWNGFGFILDLCIKGQIWFVKTWGEIEYTVIKDLYPSKWEILMIYALLFVFCVRITSKTTKLYAPK